MIFLIIVIAIILLLLFNRIKNAKQNVSNPVDTISFNTCMGFKIGDGEAFVMSRIKHLGLMNVEENENYEFENQIYSGLMFRDIQTSQGLFNNIEAISFSIESKRLKSIHIRLKAEQCDQITLVNLISKRIESKIGSPYFDTTWKKGNSVVYLDSEEMFINLS